ncbi:50S ribosomal protein L9 [Choanephora cucurbitarum]|uniref:50S ribosomal protein L9, chloroplastic n=1 Tax=Choanephora cucurbitarum TaxID=101091 RepID=A0A1C7NLA9_9FUNG|nr:50S ribosomal protein L9 [Choanephora cucurbitarum]
MSFMLRTFSRTNSFGTAQIIKRHAHKKANIKVKLNEFVEGVGIQGEIVSVRPGLMRNILYPTRKASYMDKKEANAPQSNALEELKQSALDNEKLQLSAQESAQKNKQLLSDLEGIRELQFSRAIVPNSDNTFGSVTAEDLTNKLKEEYGLDIDKATIEFKSEGGRIKSLGKHQIVIQVGQETAEMNVIVNSTA